MKKYIVLLLAVFSFTANASEVTDARKEVSVELKSTVKTLKTNLKAIDVLVTGTNKSVLILKDDAKRLRDRSGVLETNPTLMDHGQKSIKECTDNNKNIIWKNGEWICQSVELKVDCQPASDEYRYDENGDGNFHCSKHPKDEKLTYYWKPAGYGTKCNSDITKEQVYYCYYDDRNGNKVQVDDKKCTQSGAKKEPIPAKACETTWTVGAWGNCNKTCGGGTQWRTVECPTGYNCTKNPKPIDSQSCNTQSCGVAPSYSCHSYGGGWNLSGTTCYTTSYSYVAKTCKVYQTSSSHACNGSCGNTTTSKDGCMYVVSCPSGYTLTGGTCRKPITSYKPAIKNGCSGGRVYNSATQLCH